MKWYDVWSFPVEVFDEVRTWWIFRAVSTDPAVKEKLSESDPPLRVDDLGRIYTAVTVPEPMQDPSKEDMHPSYVVEQLHSIDLSLMEHRLSDMAYPQVSRIPDSWSYLIVVSPFSGAVTLGSFLGWTMRVAFVSAAAYVAIHIGTWGYEVASKYGLL